MKKSDPCAEHRAQLAVLRDDPTAEFTQALSLHLEECCQCASFGQALKQQAALFAPLRQTQPTGDLFDRIRSSVQQDVRPKRVSLGLQLAAGLVGFLAISPFLRRERERQERHADHASTEDVFARMELNLGHSPGFQITPEQELLAHLTKQRGVR